MQDEHSKNSHNLTFEDWCERAGVILIFDDYKRRELRQAWERGDDPATWVLKKYLL